MKKLREVYKKLQKKVYFFLFLEQETAEGGVIRALNYPHLGRAIIGALVMNTFIVMGVCGFPTGFISDFFGFGTSYAQKETEKKDAVVAASPKESRSGSPPQSYELQIVEPGNQVSDPDLEKGGFIVARLLNKIVTENPATPVFAQVEKAVEKDEQEIIPLKSVIIGTTKESGSERRVFVDFHTIKFPDGKTYPFKGQLLSPDGSAGLAGEYTSGKGAKLAAAGISAFIAGASAGLMTYSPGAFGGSTPEATMRNSLLGGVGNTANYAGDLFTEDMKNSRGVITAKPGLVLLVYMEGDFRFQQTQ